MGSLRKDCRRDQIQAAELSLTSSNWATAIEGLAGTAKTTTVGAIREFAEAQGYSVRRFGMTSGSVKALKEAGLQAIDRRQPDCQSSACQKRSRTLDRR